MRTLSVFIMWNNELFHGGLINSPNIKMFVFLISKCCTCLIHGQHENEKHYVFFVSCNTLNVQFMLTIYTCIIYIGFLIIFFYSVLLQQVKKICALVNQCIFFISKWTRSDVGLFWVNWIVRSFFYCWNDLINNEKKKTKSVKVYKSNKRKI